MDLDVLKLLRKYRQFGTNTRTGNVGAWQVASVASCLLRNVGCGLSYTQARAAIHRCALRIIHSSPTIPFPLFSAGSHTMSAVPSTSTSHSNFAPIFNVALEKYKRKTKQDLAKHPLLPRLQSCDSPEAILTVLREQTPEFNRSQNSGDGLTEWVTPTVNVLYSFSATIGGVVGLVNINIFPHYIV
jgi:hypothetical protein